MRSRRYTTIVDLKGLVPYRDITWQTVDCEGDCPWCGKADSATQYDDDLEETVCPACARKYNTGLDVGNPPETDRRQVKPTAEVDPVRYTHYTGNAEQPPDEPAPSESLVQACQRAADEQRPYVEERSKASTPISSVTSPGPVTGSLRLRSKQSSRSRPSRRTRPTLTPITNRTSRPMSGYVGPTSGLRHSSPRTRDITQTTSRQSPVLRQTGSDSPDP